MRKHRYPVIDGDGHITERSKEIPGMLGRKRWRREKIFQNRLNEKFLRTMFGDSIWWR
jgi:hypothetical protein